MEMENEFTNADVAVALGWEYRPDTAPEHLRWFHPNGDMYCDLPDFKNDLRHARQHVWPVLRLLMTEDYVGLLRDRLWVMWNSEKPALAFANELMFLKGKLK